MRYMGGKSRIAKDISEVLNNATYGWKEQDLKGNSRIVNNENGADRL